MTLEKLNRELKSRGFTPSGGCWEDETDMCAFSVEYWAQGYSTHGSPKAIIQHDKRTGKTILNNHEKLN